MTSGIETVKRVAELKAAAESLESFFDRFREATAPSNVDKHGVGFCADPRFAVFKVQVTFDAWYGVYGNSGCSTFGVRGRDEDLRMFFIAALNKHKEMILKEMGAIARAEANKQLEKAKQEMDALQTVLSDLSVDMPSE